MEDRWAQVSSLQSVFLIAFGGSLGCVFRWVVSKYLNGEASLFPKSTLIVNVLGSLALGVASGVLEKNQNSEAVMVFLLLGVGFAGGLSTFSTFAFDLIKLMHQGNSLLACLSVLLNTVLSVLAVILGRVVLLGARGFTP